MGKTFLPVKLDIFGAKSKRESRVTSLSHSSRWSQWCDAQPDVCMDLYQRRSSSSWRLAFPNPVEPVRHSGNASSVQIWLRFRPGLQSKHSTALVLVKRLRPDSDEVPPTDGPSSLQRQRGSVCCLCHLDSENGETVTTTLLFFLTLSHSVLDGLHLLASDCSWTAEEAVFHGCLASPWTVPFSSSSRGDLPTKASCMNGNMKGFEKVGDEKVTVSRVRRIYKYIYI